jgi:hypothetical protein
LFLQQQVGEDYQALSSAVSRLDAAAVIGDSRPAVWISRIQQAD